MLSALDQRALHTSNDDTANANAQIAVVWFSCPRRRNVRHSGRRRQDRRRLRRRRCRRCRRCCRQRPRLRLCARARQRTTPAALRRGNLCQRRRLERARRVGLARLRRHRRRQRRRLGLVGRHGDIALAAVQSMVFVDESASTRERDRIDQTHSDSRMASSHCCRIWCDLAAKMLALVCSLLMI